MQWQFAALLKKLIVQTGRSASLALAWALATTHAKVYAGFDSSLLRVRVAIAWLQLES
jgi:hypothetical protein